MYANSVNGLTTANVGIGVRLADVNPLPDLSPTTRAQPTWVVLVGEPGERMQTDTPAARAAPMTPET